jgi:hypothetical protein
MSSNSTPHSRGRIIMGEIDKTLDYSQMNKVELGKSTTVRAYKVRGTYQDHCSAQLSGARMLEDDVFFSKYDFL